MTEYLALHKVLGNGGAVQGDKRFLTAFALLVDGFGGHFLAGTAFALDEDRGLAVRCIFDNPVYRLHRRRGADNLVKPVPVYFLAIGFDEVFELLAFYRVAERDDDPFRREGFDDEVECAGLHRIHGGINGPVRRNHDHRAGHFLLADIGEHLHAGNIRKLEVQENGPRHMFLQMRDRILSVDDMRDFIGFVPQVLDIGLRQNGCVLDQKDRRFRGLGGCSGGGIWGHEIQLAGLSGLRVLSACVPSTHTVSIVRGGQSIQYVSHLFTVFPRISNPELRAVDVRFR